MTDLQRSRTVMTVKVWIRKVNRRARILYDFLEVPKRRIKEEGVELADS